MQTALEDLQLARLWVVYPGKSSYALADNIQVVPLSHVGFRSSRKELIEHSNKYYGSKFKK